MKLYELSAAYQQLVEMAADLDEETYQDTLASIQEPFEEKAENTAKVIRAIDAEAKAIKEEEKRLSDRRKTLERKQQNLKDYLKSNMYAANIKKIKGSLLKLSIRKNPPSLKVNDESYIPKKYFVEQEPKMDKKAIMNYLKEGNNIEGVSLEQSESISIK